MIPKHKKHIDMIRELLLEIYEYIYIQKPKTKRVQKKNNSIMAKIDLIDDVLRNLEDSSKNTFVSRITK